LNPFPLHPGLRRVVGVLLDAGIRYMVCGSLASSRHGEPRSTYDFDVVADLAAEHAALLTRELSADFYVDEQMIAGAVRDRGSFNLVHLGSGMKIDVFTLRDREFSRVELARAIAVPTADGGIVTMASAEDTLLTKLEWFRKTGDSSERQWRDVLGILAQQGAQLDVEYSRRWADTLGIRDILERALACTA
jgi:hypothetical protein